MPTPQTERLKFNKFGSADRLTGSSSDEKQKDHVNESVGKTAPGSIRQIDVTGARRLMEKAVLSSPFVDFSLLNTNEKTVNL